MLFALQGLGGFSGYIMAMYVLYLLSQKKLNTFMSSYQIFRNTLLKLGKSIIYYTHCLFIIPPT